MNFSSENELTKSMRLYAFLAALFLISILSIIFAFVFFILFLIEKSILGCIICFLICGLLIITVLMILRRYKKEAGFTGRLPCVRNLHGLATSVHVIGLHAAAFLWPVFAPRHLV